MPYEDGNALGNLELNLFTLFCYDDNMSFSLFDRGYTAEEIRKMHKPTHDELVTEEMRRWRESEQVLNIVRTIKASHEFYSQLEAEAWERATKRR